jgi:hypothetical protein
MNMNAAEVHAASLAQLEVLQPATLTWNGNDYPCLASATRRRRGLESGGYALDADLTVYVRAVLFGTGARPESKETLVHRGRSYRIEEVISPTGDPFLKLVCAEKTRSL